MLNNIKIAKNQPKCLHNSEKSSTFAADLRIYGEKPIYNKQNIISLT